MRATLMICNAAEVRPDGRLDIEGAFNELSASGFPARQDRLVIAGTVLWDAGESGRIRFRLDLVGPSGASAFTVEGHTDVSEPVPAQPPPKTQLVLPLEKVIFTEPGQYRVRFVVDEISAEGPSLYLVTKEP